MQASANGGFRAASTLLLTLAARIGKLGAAGARHPTMSVDAAAMEWRFQVHGGMNRGYPAPARTPSIRPRERREPARARAVPGSFDNGSSRRFTPGTRIADLQVEHCAAVARWVSEYLARSTGPG